ncbi:MAG: HAMP domain-containing sensor histidine kinase [Pseudomonadota bacterium]
MGHGRGYHVLFGVTLATMFALGVWWFVFFQRAVQFERAAVLNDLKSATAVTALKLGHNNMPPRLGRLAGSWPLEIVPYDRAGTGAISARLVPMHPQLVVRPWPERLTEVEQRVHRRWAMVIGEGALLMLLLGVTTVMLWRLVRQERRHKGQMDSFIAAVTHEMKTPVAGIKSMLQTFAAGRVPAGQQQRLYAMALKESERLEHMIENVLITGRMRVAAYKPMLEPMALRTALDKFVDHRRRHLIDRPDAVRLQWDLGTAEVNALADASALRVILENLTDNAFKYGGEEPEVTVRAHRDAEWILVSVEDAGIGFDPATAARLFTPFRRGLALDGAILHGTGLGLSIARSLAREMGGELMAHSEGKNRGSRFTVTLKEA